MKRVNMRSVSDLDNSIPTKVMLVENSDMQEKQMVNPYNATKFSTQDLFQLETEIQKADKFVQGNAQNKLRVIAQQVEFLKKQAADVLIEARSNTALHHAACNFVKQSGHIYHVYEKPSGQSYFSMLSPQEWGNNAPLQVFIGSYRLEHDHSWTPVSQIKLKDAELNIFDKCLSTTQLSGIGSSNSHHPSKFFS